MRELLDGFIDKFVLCGECKNPETVLSITKNQEILRDCKACGATTMVDMRHKLTQYILKNPPKKTKRKASDALKKERKDTGSGENTQDGDEDDDEIAKRLLQEAAELPDAEKSTIAKDEWSTDTNTETIQKRVAELAIQDGSDIEGGGDDPYDALTLWIETTRDTITAASLLEKVTQLDIKERHKTVQIISQSLFTDKILTGKEVSRFLPAFKEVSHSALARIGFLTASAVGHAQKPGRGRKEGETSKGIAWRAGKACWCQLPDAHSPDPQDTHGMVPSGHPYRGYHQTMGYACEQEICRS
jgi:translation initiation factor 5